MDNRVLELLPGGLMQVTTGGTRTAIKLARPWQPPLSLLLDPSRCPFDTRPQEEITVPGAPPDWRVLPALFTPHRHHRLVLPRSCWPEEMLQTLGGSTLISEALETARLAIAKESDEIGLFVHIGSLAGQNVSHLHWHLMPVPVRFPFAGLPTSPERLVARREGFAIVAEGARSGECLLIPEDGRAFDSSTTAALARALAWLIAHGNAKWQSAEGAPPHFMVMVRIAADHTLRYADYCPILHNWGALEYVSALLEGDALTLPWPHEVTAAYLRE